MELKSFAKELRAVARKVATNHKIPAPERARLVQELITASDADLAAVMRIVEALRGFNSTSERTAALLKRVIEITKPVPPGDA